MKKVLLGLVLALVVALPLGAQNRGEDDSGLADPWTTELLDRAMADVDPDMVPNGFGDDHRALAAWQAFFRGEGTRTREIANLMLSENDRSVEGHCLMGLVQHRREGNLPIALFHFQRCRNLFEARHGEVPDIDAPWYWHALAVTELAYVSGEMGRHQDKVDLLIERDDLYDSRSPADRGWPLMRLRRYGQARQVVAQALALDDPLQTSSALTALCAIEAEELKREASYEACLRAAEHDRRSGLGHPTPFTNAAESALGMLRFGETETLLYEASENFNQDSISNPWLDLSQLYVTEGRIAEALEAVRKMVDWRRRQPPYMEDQNRAEMEMASAAFLIVAGRAEEAARITQRTLERPDRTGFTSSESEQMEAAAALLDMLAHRTAAERLAEEASYAPWRESLGLQLTVLQYRLRAWSSGRRAAAEVAHERILLSTLRPYLAGSIEIPEWIQAEVVPLLGPGVVGAAVAEAREQETLADAEGYFLTTEAEVAFLQGRDKLAFEKIEAAVATLPRSEALLRARLLVLEGQLAVARGERQRAVAAFDQVMQIDPGAIRRAGAALPASIYASPTDTARKARDLIEDSPRLDLGKGGFQVRIEGGEDGLFAQLLSPQGAVLSAVQVTPRAGDDGVDTMVRRLAREFHDETFAPRIDLTQADLQTLDGSPTAGGGRSQLMIDSVLQEVSQ